MSEDISRHAGPFPGDGEMVRAVNEKDWGDTLLGPVQTWPASIRAAVTLSLNSDFQILVLAGPELVYLYNDASIPIFGVKHPWALGQRVEDVWPEAWDTLGPILRSVLASGRATRHQDLPLVLERSGFAEECHFTVSYSPIREEDGSTTGVFVTTVETTLRVRSDRRQRTLAELAERIARHGGDEGAFALVSEALGANPHDLPLAALYLSTPDGAHAVRVFRTGDNAGAGLPARFAWPRPGEDADPVLARLARTGEAQLFGAGELPGTGDGGQAGKMLALPLAASGQQRPRGFLLVAVNPHAPLDHSYRHFLDTAAGLVASAVASIDTVAAERRRVEAMAELDRSKSHFFANASHELRTPVTLILGPLGELLQQPAALTAQARDYVELAHRNARRMHKLVNALMDFASIEAGRMEPAPEPVAVGALTAELTGLFRSAIESTGLSLSFASTVPDTPVLVDRDMWEKVVTNLLSNAYKFTPAGTITVSLEGDGNTFMLTVRDTGIGIAPDRLPRVFERFYRGAPATGRQAEGSGIGLALVHELVRLHGGDIAVHSEEGVGTTFTVTMPWRPATDAAPPPARVACGCGDAGTEPPAAAPAQAVPVAPGREGLTRVVVVDDNADVVHYIGRVLAECCTIHAAHDAQAGLALVRATSPDLVLVDVMMPGTSGLELVRAIRADRLVRTVSVIVLSARGGSDARVEALAAGADDFIDKPFSGRELIARVNSNVRLARVRRAAIEQELELKRQVAAARDDLTSVLEGTSDSFASFDRELRVRSLNRAATESIGVSPAEALGRHLFDLLPRMRDTALGQALRAAVHGQPGLVEHYVEAKQRWYSVRVLPAPHGAVLFGGDVTARKQAERALKLANAELEQRVEARTAELREATQLLAAVFDRAPGGIAILATDGTYVRINPAYADLLGYSEAALGERRLQDLVEPDDYPEARDHLDRLVRGDVANCQCEVRYRRADGTVIWVHNFMSVIDDEQQRPRYFVQIAKDVTQRRRIEAERHTAQEELQVLYQRLQTVRENERTALAREVHDQLGQILSAAKIDLRLLEQDLLEQPGALPAARIADELHSANDTLDRAVRLVREIATELRAPSLDGQGLYAAIEWHARDFERRTRIPVRLELASALPQPPKRTGEALLRIFQEAMTNVLRHAHADNVWVCVERRGALLMLRVRDDGVGIGRRAAHGLSLGMTGMRERAALAGGRLVAGPASPRGTLVTALVPLHRDKEAAAGAAEQKER